MNNAENILKAEYSESNEEKYTKFKATRNKPTLYFIRGLPSSGKSTLAYQMFNSGLVQRICEADDYFTTAGEYQFNVSLLGKAHEQCKRETWLALDAGLSVAVSNTSCTEWEVSGYVEIAQILGANFVSIVLENRHCGENIHGCPDSKVEQMKHKFSVKL